LTLVAFTAHGTPAPQGSKTIVPTKAGPRTKESNERQLRTWRQTIADAATKAMDGHGPLAGPCELDATFVFARPRAHYRTGRHAGELKPSAPTHCDKRPDLDKLLRAVGDALTGTALIDDATIVKITARKHYGSPAAHIELRTTQ
jgi:crossover junction endodeoxyribonuclease RusA